MNQNILLTNHSLMDFILVHIFSIILFSENGITLKQNQSLEYKNRKINPVISLYPKGLPIQKNELNWKNCRSHKSPCFTTTAYSITLLAKTANYIFNYPNIFKNSSLSFSIRTQLANISSLQLDYWLENLKKHLFSIESYAIFLKGCLEIVKLKDKQVNFNTRWIQEINDVIDSIYNKLSNNEILNLSNTLELSKAINAIHHLAYEIPDHPSARELVGKMALELIYRRNSLGLFQRDRNNQKTAPLSWQFYSIASLLLSYSIYPIDKVLEETFSAFNILYKLSWNPLLAFFSFNKKLNIRYTPFELTAIIKSLYLLSLWVDKKEQADKLNQILYNSYFPILTEKFFTNYYQSIHAIYSRFMDIMQVPYKLNSHGHNKIHRIQKAPVFPNIIQIIHSQNYPKKLQDAGKFEIRWINNSPLYIRYPLELCICLLDYLENHQKQEQNNNNEENKTYDWLNLLFSILGQHS